MNPQAVQTPDISSVILRSWMRTGSPERIAVAFSGGADSTALLDALNSLKERTGFYICALHINHGLRVESDDDEECCRIFCESRSIPFSAEKLDLRGRTEEEARELRYAALDRLASANRCGCVAAAHHRGDQAELVIMRLMQGSLTGMAGMRERSPLPNAAEDRWLWRPLLGVDHDDLCAYLKVKDIPWLEDKSNLDTTYLRNYIRHDILPLLAARQDKLSEHLSAVAGRIRQAREDLRSLADGFLLEHAVTAGPCPRIEAEAFFGLSSTLRAAVVRRFLEKTGLSTALPETSLNRILDLEKGRTIDLGTALIRRSGQYLHLISKDTVSGFDLSQISISPYTGDVGDGKRCQAIPGDLVDGLTVRKRLDGDRIIPFGMKKHRKLQDYLTDRKIDSPFRDHIPLLCRGDEILWVIGVGPSESCRISDPQDAVILRYTGQLPWE